MKVSSQTWEAAQKTQETDAGRWQLDGVKSYIIQDDREVTIGHETDVFVNQIVKNLGCCHKAGSCIETLQSVVHHCVCVYVCVIHQGLFMN